MMIYVGEFVVQYLTTIRLFSTASLRFPIHCTFHISEFLSDKRIGLSHKQ
jgi:hypothetical protein